MASLCHPCSHCSLVVDCFHLSVLCDGLPWILWERMSLSLSQKGKEALWLGGLALGRVGGWALLTFSYFPDFRNIISLASKYSTLGKLGAFQSRRNLSGTSQAEGLLVCLFWSNENPPGPEGLMLCFQSLMGFLGLLNLSWEVLGCKVHVKVSSRRWQFPLVQCRKLVKGESISPCLFLSMPTAFWII